MLHAGLGSHSDMVFSLMTAPQDGPPGSPAPLTGEDAVAEVDPAEATQFPPKMSLRAVQMEHLCRAAPCILLAHCLPGPSRGSVTPILQGKLLRQIVTRPRPPSEEGNGP